MNRLGGATSPYLLQHAGNPVDWQEWGEPAFAEARERDVPVLLSVGYAACHWCHVMAHESFEDPPTAALMNERFVCVKVDREERPDVDAVYMAATQALTGSGGWPMTCFLTPSADPFFCGTYFPRQQFQRLLLAVGDAWRDQRDEVLTAGRRIVGELAQPRFGGAGRPFDEGVVATALAGLSRDYDARRGGFGGAPKFPPSLVLEALLREHARSGAGDPLRMVAGTCEAMARGGIYDQLAGGFARYSVDAGWVVPHFEKMLYDNALLLRVYAHWWRSTGSALARRVAAETAGFLLRDLRTPEGGFASALDADTDGVEGLTYVWTPAQLRSVLGDADGTWAAGLFGVTESGTFEHGVSTLQLPADPEPGEADRYRAVRSRLAAARADRPQPARDDKVVAAWNGLAIAALADAGTLLDEPSLVAAAVAAAHLLADRHWVGGRLRRASRGGRVGEHAGVLEDYADVAEGLLALHQATGSPRWLSLAGELLDVMLDRFADGGGGFYDTADDAEPLIRRPWDPTDGPTPCGPAATAGALLTYAALAGSPRHREAAEAALGVLAPVAGAYPRAGGWAWAVAEAALSGPLQVAVVLPTTEQTGGWPPSEPAGGLSVAGPGGAHGPAGAPFSGPAAKQPSGTAAGSRPDGGLGPDSGYGPDGLGGLLLRAARLGTSPGAVVVAGPPDAPGVPLLAARPLVAGDAAAYVCRGFVCDVPSTDPDAVAAAVGTVSTAKQPPTSRPSPGS